MKLVLLISVLLIASFAVVAQTQNTVMANIVSDGKVVLPVPAPIKLPAERSATIKQIQERQDQLATAWKELDAQKIIIAQRAALELKMTAEQWDQMDLTPTPEGYVFKPKEKPVPAPAPTPTPVEKKP